VYTRAQNLKCEATKARRAAERSSHGILNGARWRPGEIFKIHLPPSLRDTEKTLARTEIKNIFFSGATGVALCDVDAFFRAISAKNMT
jgi:hypothetical protein